MCKYCEKGTDLKVIQTSFLQLKGQYEKIYAFIHNTEADETAGLMIGNYEGYRYIGIYYCPICGKKL